MAFSSLSSLRQPQTRTIQPPLLDDIQVAEKPSLLDAIIECTAVLEEAKAQVDLPVAPEPEAESDQAEIVAVQLVGFHLLEIPCPGCGYFPCKPHQLNGHGLKWITIPGDIVMVEA